MEEPYQEVERRWAEWNRLDPDGMVVCASGTAALHLALECLSLPPLSEVITNDFTMIAVPRAITLSGLTPTFVDCDYRLNLDVTLLPRAFVNKVSAVIAVHVYGRACEMDSITGTAKTFGVPVIEDLAEAHGLQVHPDSTAACWSFYRNKTIAGEEGGAVWFKDSNRAVHARMLRSLGFTPEHDMVHIPRGHNYRMSNAHAKLIINSLNTYDAGVRHRIIYWYDSKFPDNWRMPHREAPWVYDFRIPGLKPPEMDAMIKRLNSGGIKARHGFKPAHTQCEFYKCLTIGRGEASRMASQVMYLPVTPGMTEEDATLIYREVRNAYSNC